MVALPEYVKVLLTTPVNWSPEKIQGVLGRYRDEGISSSELASRLRAFAGRFNSSAKTQAEAVHRIAACLDKVDGAWDPTKAADRQCRQLILEGRLGTVIAQASAPFVKTKKDGAGFFVTWQVVSVGPGTGDVEYSLVGTGVGHKNGVSFPLIGEGLASSFSNAVHAARLIAGSNAVDDLVVGIKIETFGDVDVDIVPKDLGGPSGGLALAISLLCAWTKMPISTTNNMAFTGEVLSNGTLKEVDSGREKFEILNGANQFRKFFHYLKAYDPPAKYSTLSKPLSGSLADVWKMVCDDRKVLRAWVDREIRTLNGVNDNTGLKPSDFDDLLIQINKIELDQAPTMVAEARDPAPQEPPQNAPQEDNKDDSDGSDQLSEGAISRHVRKSTPIQGLESFMQEVLIHPYIPGELPMIIVGPPGIGKSFSTRSLARRFLVRWSQGGNKNSPLAFWVNLPKLEEVWNKAEDPLQSPARLIADAMGVEGTVRDHIVYHLQTSDLVLILDSFDQSMTLIDGVVDVPIGEDEVRKERKIRAFLDAFESERASKGTFYPIVMSRQITENHIRSQFPEASTQVEFELIEFTTSVIRQFLNIRFPNDVVSKERVLDIPRHAGLGLLSIPMILEMLCELILKIGTEGHWTDDDESLGGKWITRYSVYKRIVRQKLYRAASQTPGIIDAYQFAIDTESLLNQLSLQLWDDKPGRNYFSLTKWRREVGKVANLMNRSGHDTIQVLSRAGIFDLGVPSQEVERASEQLHVNAVHRTMLEFFRAEAVVGQLVSAEYYGAADAELYDWTNPRLKHFSVPLTALIDQKVWDEQWQEVFVFVASFLSVRGDEKGRHLVPFLDKVRGLPEEDDMIPTRLDRTIRCLRQAWYLYSVELDPEVSPALTKWCADLSQSVCETGDWLLCPSALGLVQQTSVDGRWLTEEILTRADAFLPDCASPLACHLLVRKFRTSPRQRRASIANGLTQMANFGSKELLRELFDAFRTEAVGEVRGALAGVLAAWSSHADPDQLKDLVGQLRITEDPDVLPDYVKVIGHWFEHGQKDSLSKLIDAFCGKDETEVRRHFVQAISHWTPKDERRLALSIEKKAKSDRPFRAQISYLVAAGIISESECPRLLMKVVSGFRLEKDPAKRELLAEAALFLAHGADREILDMVLPALSFEKDWRTRDTLAMLAGTLVRYAARDDLEFLIREMDHQEPEHVASLAITVGMWSHLDNEDLACRLSGILASRRFEGRTEQRMHEALGRCSKNGCQLVLKKLVEALKSTSIENRSILAATIGYWANIGDGTLLRSIFREMDSNGNESVKANLVQTIGLWNAHGDGKLLEKLIEMTEVEVSPLVRMSLADAIGDWSVHGDCEKLRRIITILRSTPTSLQASIIRAVFAWRTGPPSPSDKERRSSSRHFFMREHRFRTSSHGIVMTDSLTNYGSLR